MKIQIKNLQQGFTLVEVVIGLSLIMITTLAVIGLATQNVRLSNFVLEKVQAEYLLEEGVEATRLVRDEDWALLEELEVDSEYYLDFVDGTWAFTATPQATGIFTRTVSLSSVKRDGNDDIATSGTTDPQTLLVTIEVSWLSSGKAKSENIKFYLTDFFTD